MRWTSTAAIVLTALPAVDAIAAQHLQTPPSASKIVVKTQDDLPRYSYPVPTTAAQLLFADDPIFNAWAAKVAQNIDDIVLRYDIQDRAALRDLLGQRLNYEIIVGQNQRALATIERIRSLEDKPDAKLLSGVSDAAILQARISSGENNGPAFEKIYVDEYARQLKPLPWSVVGNSLKESRSEAQTLTPEIIRGVLNATIEPAVTKSHMVDQKIAGELLFLRYLLRTRVPLRAATVRVLSDEVAAKNVQKPDIWAARDITLSPADNISPVVVAVWDSGTDLRLFPTQTYTDPSTRGASAINAHGLAFDLEARPTSGALLPLDSSRASQYPGMLADLQGFSDLEASIESPAADAVKQKMASLKAEEVPSYLEESKFFATYVHGTHVAGIIARGNPAVRLAVARRTFDYRNVPEPPTDELLHRRAIEFQTTVDWFRAHGVRVVNMSWGISPQGYESDLQANGIGKDAAERKTLAAHYFQIDRDALYNALKGAPEILFICAAGNSDSDTAFDETAPSSFALPNLLIVGAVDRAGDEASFTSYGKTVAVDANGYEVVSTVPGGRTLMMSGTSMASPNVVNLAAKLLAVDPNLTPGALREVIVAGAKASADGRRHNIDPSASLALLKRRR